MSALPQISASIAIYEVDAACNNLLFFHEILDSPSARARPLTAVPPAYQQRGPPPSHRPQDCRGRPLPPRESAAGANTAVGARRCMMFGGVGDRGLAFSGVGHTTASWARAGPHSLHAAASAGAKGWKKISTPAEPDPQNPNPETGPSSPSSCII
jgi:hypothetical protein